MRELGAKDGGLHAQVLGKMRIGIDDLKGIPLFNFRFMFGGHRLKKFKNEDGLRRRREQLRTVIVTDLTNIFSFIEGWNQIRQPMVANWEGRAT